MTALSIHRLCIRDPSGAVLLSEVSFSVAAGEAFCLIGETGSGKSLVAQALFGLLPAGLHAEGHIRIGTAAPVAAADAAALQAFWRKQTMLIPQEPSQALDPLMTVGRQMALCGLDRPAVAAALRAVDLGPEIAAHYPFMLSGGMAQRVVIAAALGTGAPLLVADEPTKGLDAGRVEQCVALLRSVKQSGRTLLVITHDGAVTAALADRVAVMRQGRIVETGHGGRVLSAPEHDYTRQWIAADPAHWPVRAGHSKAAPIVLAARAIAFSHGGPPLFSGLDIQLRQGAVLSVGGRSGSGKTTLGNVLLGLARPQAGEILWLNRDPHRDKAHQRRHRRHFQKLHQDPMSAFAPHRRIAAQLRDLEKVVPDLHLHEALPPLLERLSLRPALLERLPGEISGGEAQRLALARLLLMRPLCIVADEPTSRLDPIVQRDTMLLLREHVEKDGLALVLISHDIRIAAAIADQHLDLQARTSA